MFVDDWILETFKDEFGSTGCQKNWQNLGFETEENWQHKGATSLGNRVGWPRYRQPQPQPRFLLLLTISTSKAFSHSL